MTTKNGNGYKRLVIGVLIVLVSTAIIALAGATHNGITDSIADNAARNEKQDSALVNLSIQHQLEQQAIDSRLDNIDERQKRAEKVDALILKALRVPQREWPDPTIDDEEVPQIDNPPGSCGSMSARNQT